MEEERLHLQRAKSFLVHEQDYSQLRHACLELRMCVERIAYRKLENRLDRVPLSSLKGWQPKRVIETIVELDDESVGRDSTFRGARENKDGSTGRPFLIGTVHGINAKRIGAIWQKLSSFLHIGLPTSEKREDVTALATFIAEIIEELTPIAAETFEMSLAQTLHFECTQCSTLIVRNKKRFSVDQIVPCPNNVCRCEFVVSVFDNKFSFKAHVRLFDCVWCGAENKVGVHSLKKLDQTSQLAHACEICEKDNIIRQHFNIDPPNQAEHDD